MSARTIVRTAVAVVALTSGLIPAIAQSPQIRDLGPTPTALPVPTGTGVITGVVWSADATPQPIRRAVVSLSGGGLPSPRSTITNDRGEFTFSRLPAGSFGVTARKASYLAAAYGSQRPARPGSSIALAAGQRVAVAMAMFKGAVIGGTLRDGSGMPVTGVTVTATDARTVGAPNSGTTAIESAVSDDRGVYRIYGLMPGDYLVSATPSSGGAGEVGVRTTAEMDALLSTIAQRPNTPTATPTPIPTPPPVGFAPIYFPGTAIHTEASPVRVAAGEEQTSVSFELSPVRIATVSGVVSGPVPNLAAVQLSVVISGPRANTTGTMGITSAPPNAQGEFKYGNLPPGQYRIIAKVRRGATESAAPSGGSSFSGGGGTSGGSTLPSGGGTLGPNPEQLFAVAEVMVNGQDISGISLNLQPGGTLSGKVAFDSASATPPADLTPIRIGLTIPGGTSTSSQGMTTVGNGAMQVNPVGVAADGTFQVISIGPGSYQLNCQLPQDLLKVWKLRSAMLDGRDLLDGVIEGPNINWSGVKLTLSDKRTELSGTLQLGAGQAADYYVVAFSTDRANWRIGARRSMAAKPATDGRFVFTDLPAGEYYLAALTDLDPLDWQTPAFLEQVVPAGLKVSLGEGEKKVQDLRIR